MFQATVLLITSILFLLMYIGILMGTVYSMYWTFAGPRDWFLIRILVFRVALLVFLLLLNGCFTRSNLDDD